MRVQYSLTAPPNDMWVDLGEGEMSRPDNEGTKWIANSTKVPAGNTVFFRTMSTATNFTAGNGPVTAPCRVVASPFIKLSMKAKPDSDPDFNTMTHPEEGMTYELSYQNIGTVSAENV